jgi:hypothetical protein
MTLFVTASLQHSMTEVSMMPCLSSARRCVSTLLVTLVAATAGSAQAMQPASSTNPASTTLDLDSTVGQSLGLRAWSLSDFTLETTHSGDTFTAKAMVNGQPVEFTLQRTSVRAPGHQLLADAGAGLQPADAALPTT